MSDADAQHLLENVFVRSFHRAAKGRYSQRYWRAYIAAFRGRFDHDHDKILGLLTDYGVQLVSDEYVDPEAAKEYVQKVEDDLYALRHRPMMAYNRAKDLREKCNRDARLASFLVAYREQLAKDSRSATVLSSSPNLRKAIEICGGSKLEPEPVFHLGAIAWLLSLIPGARLTLGALRGVLFDTAVRRHLPQLERHLVRVVHASEEYAFHWSRRNTLYRAVREKLATIARQRGESPQEIERLAVSDTDEGRGLLVESVAEALDQTARSRSEDELTQLRARIAELEEDRNRRGR